MGTRPSSSTGTTASTQRCVTESGASGAIFIQHHRSQSLAHWGSAGIDREDVYASRQPIYMGRTGVS